MGSLHQVRGRKALRVALVYDRLFPHTIGGLERYYDGLARGLLAQHRVTYVTRDPGRASAPPTSVHPYAVVAVAPASAYYSTGGRRLLGPPVHFGIGVFLHMLRHGHSYDIVHCAAFPYFSVIACRLALSVRRRRRR